MVANSPELYPLSNRLSGHRQITDFQYDTSIQRVYEELVSNRTELIVVDNKSPAKVEFDKILDQNYTQLLLSSTKDNYEIWILNR